MEKDREKAKQWDKPKIFWKSYAYVFIQYPVKKKKESFLKLQSKLGKIVTIGFTSIVSASERCCLC